MIYRGVFLNITAILLALPATGLAQGDGARVYWKTLADSNAVTFMPIRTAGNVNPLDPGNTVNPNSEVDATVVLAGFHKVLPVAKRSATLSGILPMGNIRTQTVAAALTTQQATSGFGDPMVQFTFNLVGAPAIMNLAQYARYEPKFTLDVLGNLAFPVGEHNKDKALNLGQNRWYGRVGAPMMFRIGSWVPGKRTTIEVLPAVWMFGQNDSYVGGTLKTDPLLQLEGHLTRDFTEHFWGSFDVLHLTGGKATIANSGITISRPKLESTTVGLTLGYQVTNNLEIRTSYVSTVADSGPQDMRRDELRLTMVFGWHKLVEGMGRVGKAH